MRSALESTELGVLALPESTFHHFGTMPEFLDATDPDSDLAREFSFSGLVMDSNLEPDSVPKRCVVENSILGGQVKLNPNSIVSCVRVEGRELEIPGGLALQTVPVGSSGSFVTLAFGVGDDMKAVAASPGDLCWNGKKLKEYFR